MNSLLVNVTVPQLHCVFAGGRFVYVEKVSSAGDGDNYRRKLERIEVESIWKNFNAIGGYLSRETCRIKSKTLLVACHERT